MGRRSAGVRFRNSYLEIWQRMARLALLVLLAGPARAWSGDPGALRAALIRELRSDPTDDVGVASANLLASLGGGLRIAPLSKAAGEYRVRDRRLTVDRDYLESAGRGVDDEVLARRLAATIVHELEHSFDLRESGRSPHCREPELAAYAASAVFLRRRLERDPNYAGLGEFDAMVRRRLKAPPPPKRWWSSPIPPGEEIRYRDAAKDHYRIDEWLLARASADGLKGIERAFAWVGALRFPPAAQACQAESDETQRRVCTATVKLIRERIARFSALLGPAGASPDRSSGH